MALTEALEDVGEIVVAVATVETEAEAEGVAGPELARTRRRSGCHAQSWAGLCSRSVHHRLPTDNAI